MMPRWKIGVVLALVVAAAGVMWWQQGRRAKAEADAAALAEASAAMKAMNAQDDSFPPQFTKAIAAVSTDVIFGAQRAAATLQTKVLPMLDGYLATIDHAVRVSDSYLARVPNPKTQAGLDKIRARGVAMHAFRGRLAAAAETAARSGSVDALTGALSSASMELMMSGLGK